MCSRDINGPKATASCGKAALSKHVRIAGLVGANPTIAILAKVPEQGFTQRLERVDFDEINAAARAVLPSLLKRWLPTGQLRGREWVALNPRRADTGLGSFRINLVTGKWADFASSEARGGDPVSLAAYLHHDGNQVSAARSLKRMLM